MKKTIEWKKLNRQLVLVTTDEGDVVPAVVEFFTVDEDGGSVDQIYDVVAVASMPEPYEDKNDER